MKDADTGWWPYRFLLLTVLLVVGVLFAVVVYYESSARPLWISAAATPTTAATVAASASPVAATSSTEVIAQVTPKIAPATPWGVLAGDESPASPVTATALPELPPVALLGPPAGSPFRLGDTVTFYWEWPGMVADDWRYAIYLQSEQGTAFAGMAEPGNLGSMQQVSVMLAGALSGPGTYQWQIVLEDEVSGTSLARSEQRPIVVLADSSR